MSTVSIPAKRRFEELDLARAIPLILLPLVHVYEEMEIIAGIPESMVDGYSWILYLCTLMPSVFMILMGANINFSRKATAKDLFRRGLTFVCIGFTLSLFRCILPSIVTSIVNGNWDALINDSLYYTLTSDIYDFVGLAFIAFAVFKTLNLTPLFVLLASFAMLAIDSIIPQFEVSDMYLSGFLGRFIYMDTDSCFPLMTWMVFPSIGYCFGAVYKSFRSEEQRCSFVKKMCAVSVVGLLSAGLCLVSYGLNPLLIMTSPANEYITDLPNVVMLTFLAGIWFALFYFIYFKVKETKVCRFLIEVSKGIMPFYVAQWIIIGWVEYLAEGLIDYEDGELMGHAGFWTLTIVTIIISIVTVLVYNRIKANKKVK